MAGQAVRGPAPTLRGLPLVRSLNRAVHPLPLEIFVPFAEKYGREKGYLHQRSCGYFAKPDHLDVLFGKAPFHSSSFPTMDGVSCWSARNLYLSDFRHLIGMTTSTSRKRGLLRHAHFRSWGLRINHRLERGYSTYGSRCPGNEKEKRGDKEL